MTQRSYSIPKDLTRLAGGAKLNVYVALAEHCDAEGSCWPSVAVVAEEAGVDRSTAVRALKWLVGQGWVQRTARPIPGSKMKGSSEYYLPDLDRRISDGARAHHRWGADAPSMVQERTEVGALLHPGRCTSAPENSSQELLPRTQAPASPSHARPVDHELVAALADAEGVDIDRATRTELARLEAAGRSIAKAGGTADDVPAAVVGYRLLMPPGTMVTAQGLKGRWSASLARFEPAAPVAAGGATRRAETDAGTMARMLTRMDELDVRHALEAKGYSPADVLAGLREFDRIIDDIDRTQGPHDLEDIA